MKIIIEKVKVNKKNYLLYINEKEFLVDRFYYETLLPYDNKEIEQDEYLDIIAISKANEILNKSYRKIFSHEISRSSFKEKLAKADLNEEEIKRVCYFLQKEGYLNDELLVEHYLDVYRENKGVNALKSFLISKKVSYHLIDKYLKDFKEDKEHALLLGKNYVKTKTGSKRMLSLKLKAYLTNKGYEEKTIDYVMNHVSYKEDDESLTKEMAKYEKLYHNDYYKIYNKLMSRGYNSSDIRKVLKKEDATYED